MPDLVYNLNMADAKQLGFNQGPVEMARASYGGRSKPDTTINWPVIERAAVELVSDSQAFARMLLTARDSGIK